MKKTPSIRDYSIDELLRILPATEATAGRQSQSAEAFRREIKRRLDVAHSERDAIAALLDTEDNSIDLPNGVRVCWVTPTADDPDCWLVVGKGLEGAFPRAIEAVRFALNQKGPK